MSHHQERLFRIGKRLFQLLLTILLLLAITMSIGWSLLRSDHPYVIQQLQATALQKYNAAVQLEGYELQWIKPFPLMRLKVQGLSIASIDAPQHPVIQVNSAESALHPWELFHGKFNAHPIIVIVYGYTFTKIPSSRATSLLTGRHLHGKRNN